MKLDEQSINAHLRNLYGYEPKHEDEWLIKHLLVEAETLIKNFCHVTSIPEGAVHPAIDYVCGRFFLTKINTGTLVDDEGAPLFEFSAPESSVKVGDVTVSFESGYGSATGDNAFLSMVEELGDEHNFKLQLVHFRRLKMP